MAKKSADMSRTLLQHGMKELGSPIQHSRMLSEAGCGVQMPLQSNQANEGVERPQCVTDV